MSHESLQEVSFKQKVTVEVKMWYFEETHRLKYLVVFQLYSGGAWGRGYS